MSSATPPRSTLRRVRRQRERVFWLLSVRLFSNTTAVATSRQKPTEGRNSTRSARMKPT